MPELQNGQRLRVFQLDTDEQGEYWAHWFDGVYLTTENVGNGVEARLKHSETGEHIHIKSSADDLKIVPKP